MALRKAGENEAVAEDGTRILCGNQAISYVKGSRYLTIPVELGGDGELQVHLAQTSPWMENGQPCATEGTLNLGVLRSRIGDALKLLGRKFTIDS